MVENLGQKRRKIHPGLLLQRKENISLKIGEKQEITKEGGNSPPLRKRGVFKIPPLKNPPP